MKEKKTFSGGLDSLLNPLNTHVEAPVNDPGSTKGPRRNVGRPNKNERGIIKTSRAGLADGLTRMTTIVREEYQDKLKYIAFRDKTSIREILDEAITDYLEKYEQSFGKIELND